MNNKYQTKPLPAANPRIKDILPNLEKWAQKCAAAIPERNITATLQYGKRQVDNGNYHAIVVKEGKWQIGSIPLRQEKSGMLTYNIQKPLGGEWYRDEELVLNKCLAQIKEAMESIAGVSYIKLGTEKDRLELEETVLKRKQESMERNMTFNVQVRKYNSWLPMSGINRDIFEKWRLDYQHEFNADNTARIKLVGQKLGDRDNETVIIADGFIDMKHPEKPVILQEYNLGEYPALIEKIVNEGHAEWMNDKVEYEYGENEYGSDEDEVRVEKCSWKRIDVSEGYRQYLNDRNGMHLFSPLTNIRQVSLIDPDSLSVPPAVKKTLKCTIGGITELEKKVGKESDVLPIVRDYPDYAFVAHEMAQEVFAKEIGMLKIAQQRMTDVQISWTADGTFVRCRMDGEQQMRMKIPRQLADSTVKAPDRSEAEFYVAATAYRNEMIQDVERNKGLRR